MPRELPRDMASLLETVGDSFPGRCVRSFSRAQGLDRSMVIASQAFTTLIPLMIVCSTFLPLNDPDAVSEAVVQRMGLSGEAAESVEQVFGNADPGSVGALSVVLLLYSGFSFSRRMQRMFLHIWQIPVQRGVRISVDAALGLLALLLEIALLSALRGVISGLSLPISWGLLLPVPIAASMVLWTSIPWLLLGRRTEWRRLLPGGLLTGVGVTLYGAATSLYMPKLIEVYSDRYGLFGVTIALVSWLLCISVIVVSATVFAAELDRAPEKWACRLRLRLGIEALTTEATRDPDVDA
jgi:membrane protein